MTEKTLIGAYADRIATFNARDADYADLEKRLREWAALHDKCGQQGTRTPLLVYEAADALASLTRELEAHRALFALIPDNFRSDGETSFWIGEYDPVHKTTGRSMEPAEREQLSTVAYKVLGCAIALRASDLSRGRDGEDDTP